MKVLYCVLNNKKPKIKHSTLIADYFSGGYQDVDMETKISILKATWVKSLLDSNMENYSDYTFFR